MTCMSDYSHIHLACFQPKICCIFNIRRNRPSYSSSWSPGLGADLWKDNARPKCAMKRPYSTHLSYENILLDFKTFWTLARLRFFAKDFNWTQNFTKGFASTQNLGSTYMTPGIPKSSRANMPDACISCSFFLYWYFENATILRKIANLAETRKVEGK